MTAVATRVVYGDMLALGSILVANCWRPVLPNCPYGGEHGEGLRHELQVVLPPRVTFSGPDCLVHLVVADETGEQHGQSFGSNATVRVRLDGAS